MNGSSTPILGEVRKSLPFFYIEVQKLIALSGHGLIPISLPAVSEHLKDETLIEVGALKHIEEHLCLISASRRIQNPIAAKLIKQFKVS
ncbi:MAG: hypothetical protein A2428_10050 [Bdellovibrionales bacterium RIFOXYC1_FULL_54_43]|nr:MAG: hypothetical protein A2428_10050 [Bdellovibrionales bacterium RIFOXYC1_FULL_54_43]OFZ80525.1 MAG: hypothetical protein A2603_13145 [Bdellovibrionales bacterium RIFOXYD1_FULL_55_31]